MKIYLYVLDTLADWEIAFLTAEINSARYLRKDLERPEIITVGRDLSSIKTMGGLTISPQLTAGAMQPVSGDLVVLPGADTWQSGQHGGIINKVRESLQKNVTVAAICGATLALADGGILDDKAHTSNDKDFLKLVCPKYQGKAYYQDLPVVVADNLITAAGIAPLEFAKIIFKRMNLMAPDTLEAWYQLYKTQDKQYFYALMNSIQ